MLSKLHIQNYAIIEEIDIRFSGHLNIITGETGAGKSILLGALSLILGQRADSNVLLQKDKKCFVEGYFTNVPVAVNTFLEGNNLDIEDTLVIRREIAVNGKSRAFVNDTPVTLAQLQELSSMLVDLHQQFDTLAIGEGNFQREAIDALAGNESILQQYQGLYKQLKQAQKELTALQNEKSQFNKELDYHQFLYNELNEAALKENELEEAEAELKLLNDSEGIKTMLSKIYFGLKEDEQPIAQQLKQLSNQLQYYVAHHAGIAAIIERLQASAVEIDDIAEETNYINDKIIYDPQRIEELNEKLATGYKLLKKHGVKTTAELLEIQTGLEQKLQAVLNIDEAIAGKEQLVNILFNETKVLARQLSDKRMQIADPFCNRVNVLLAQVGMPNARLKVSIDNLQQDQLQPHGFDIISFLFDANNSGQFAPVRKVASGGELSRLMLCIKSLVAASMDLPTMIFDEIDTGISGEAAKQVGVIMKSLSKERQVICITHQPQIAGKADAHFYVYKDAFNNTVRTGIKLLSQEERITAIAQMLSGEEPTAAALENAREMVVG